LRLSGFARALAMVAIMAACAPAAGQTTGPTRWIASWASGQQTPEPQNALPETDLNDATLRQTVPLSIGGRRLRVRLSNAFGHAPLEIDAAHVALALAAGSPRIRPGSDRALTFNGRPQVVIPPGAEYWSDPVDLNAPPLSDLTVSLHLPRAPDGQTSHPGSRTTSWLVHGNAVGAEDLGRGAKALHWFQLSGVDVAASGGGAVVTLGDSITDGRGSTTDGDDRWPDLLARRLQASPQGRSLGVLNAGIGGNRVLLDGLGPNAMARLDRDVLGQSGVRAVIVLEGVNDLGGLTRDAPAPVTAHAAMVSQLLGAYAQIIALAHAHGLRVIGGTITPYAGAAVYHPTAENEADRLQVNAWIRTSGHFDAVADFDAALRDPRQPDRLLPAYDSGDHLHPSPAGFKAMAEAVPLTALKP
jgi:lysophospholipase L1-like esterase